MKPKIDKFATEQEWPTWVGQKITKYSHKPFKSGSVIGTPLAIETDPLS